VRTTNGAKQQTAKSRFSSIAPNLIPPTIGLSEFASGIQFGTHPERMGLNALKGTAALPWGYAVSKCAFQEALRNLETGIKNWSASKKGAQRFSHHACSKGVIPGAHPCGRPCTFSFGDFLQSTVARDPFPC
jgi:hypothetical protein